MKYRRITLREYDYIRPGNDDANASSRGRTCASIPDSAFNYLERLLAYDEEKKFSDDYALFLKRTSWEGQSAFQVRNHVGVLQTRCGTQIEILPKVGESEDKSRQMLVALLRTLRNAPFRLGGDAILDKAPMHLMEVFINYFLSEVNHLVKRGIRSEYVAREENSQFLKGKFLVRQHVRVNAVQQQRFYCMYDEFLHDCAENRLIHRTLSKVATLTRSAENQRLCQELMFIFQDVPLSRDIVRDFSLCHFNRSTIHYRHALEWCRMILEEESSVPSPGRKETISVLFPMERVFESYVGWMLSQADVVSSLRFQVSKKWLIEQPQKFHLKPDFVFSLHTEKSKLDVVGDAKWKLIDSQTGRHNFAVSQTDLYQLYTYGKKYNASCLFLFYPRTNVFSEPIDWRFDDAMAIRLIPVPLPDHHSKPINGLRVEIENFSKMIQL